MKLETERLLLRRWKESDRAPFAIMSADPHVMRHFPAVLDRKKSDALIDRLEKHFETHGFGLFAVERKDTTEFIGTVGLQFVGFDAPFTPAVEVGWRIAANHQNQGFATEAALEVLRFAFEDMSLTQVVSFTVAANTASQRVMLKIGFQADPAQGFDHPNLPEGHPLRAHVFYSLSRE